MTHEDWQDLGPIEAFQDGVVTLVPVGNIKVAISRRGDDFGAVSGLCNHAGGPLGEGHLDGEYIVCPWHHWKFHRKTGAGEPGFEDDAVPSYELRTDRGRLWLRAEPATSRRKKPHPPHPLARPIQREDGPIRIAGISTTVMDRRYPRYSTSESLLQLALDFAASELACQTKLIRLNDLRIRHCEGYYSKSAQACTWPCSITQMDDKDQMTEIYEAMVHWADVVLLATPIRWGASSSLYHKMAERMNCVQNQITIRDNVLIRRKVAGFIVTGGQDNVQDVAGHLLGFFSELGFVFPQFPYITHSRGWSAEDMEHNIDYVMKSSELREGARELARRAVEMSATLLGHQAAIERIARGGRKAHHLDMPPV